MAARAAEDGRWVQLLPPAAISLLPAPQMYIVPGPGFIKPGPDTLSCRKVDLGPRDDRREHV